MAFRKPELLVWLAVAVATPGLHAQDPGNSCRKSGPQPAFADDCPVVQIAWSIPEQDQGSHKKPSGSYSDYADFSEEEVAELQFQVPLRTESIPESETQPKPESAVNRQVLSDLMSLVKPTKPSVPTPLKPTEPTPAIGSESPLEQSEEDTAPKTATPEPAAPQKAVPDQHYLAELSGLLNQDSAWIKLNRGYSETHAKDIDKAQPAYMAELQDLSTRIKQYRTASARRVQPPAEPIALLPTATPGHEAPLDRLFAPMSAVKIHGGAADSSAPKQPWQIPLDDPRSTASTNAVDYFHGSIPGYYFPPMRYAVTRPNRNLYPFQNNPLYFEDPNLERCGVHSDCLTNFWSIGHFAFNTGILPYRLAAQPPHCCVPTLGDCPTCNEFDSTAYLPPWSWAGLIAETGAITGLVFIIP